MSISIVLGFVAVIVAFGFCASAAVWAAKVGATPRNHPLVTPTNYQSSAICKPVTLGTSNHIPRSARSAT
jgi:hypothetical protein